MSKNKYMASKLQVNVPVMFLTPRYDVWKNDFMSSVVYTYLTRHKRRKKPIYGKGENFTVEDTFHDARNT